MGGDHSKEQHFWWSEGSRTGQRDKLTLDAIVTEAKPILKGALIWDGFLELCLVKARRWVLSSIINQSLNVGFPKGCCVNLRLGRAFSGGQFPCRDSAVSCQQPALPQLVKRVAWSWSKGLAGTPQYPLHKSKLPNCVCRISTVEWTREITIRHFILF